MGNNQQWDELRKAAVLCQQRHYERALRAYGDILAQAKDDAKLAAMARVGRGEIKMLLGYYSSRTPNLPLEDPAALAAEHPDSDLVGAIDELEDAVQLDPQSGRAWAQLGEAHRMFARDFFRVMPEPRFEAHLERARQAYEKAGELLPEQEAWLAAHEGARLCHVLWRYLYRRDSELAQQQCDSPDTDAMLERALACFQHALSLAPDYIWAKRFLGYALTMRNEYEKAMQVLGEADVGAGRVDATTQRIMAMLSRYAAGAARSASEEPGIGTAQAEELRVEAARRLRQAQSASQQAIALDSEDTLALYTNAAAWLDRDTPEAYGIASEACGRILNQAADALLLATLLYTRMHKSEDLTREFDDQLSKHIREAYHSSELGGLAQHDPALSYEMCAALSSRLDKILK
ncbi:hypothetical protein [Haliangium ochraceum]|uniref:Tetratricopeptide repeat protein n=1 Tax=Haliangium ochraceum (strain DSM 14365 / JCM 11303 / SMP-2) TaxID=502025 RepID=D0LR87_HALO1|nr:hypothetical protein [Haliangium ochraceum]ACY17115.1 hypothetical protein Hoch_4624 [Haliangium ochraceum DSM 14365]